ncbi:TPA: Rha family transcriptional regulator [Providencia stuartii]|uniref:Rha family transcriptional regulator n=1 Tax=Providencia stuartii TaxID=588 RepID=UPI0023EAD4B1|nr:MULTISPECIES: Rha family transcriptional regulator [Providencia]MDF4173666.1 Rha family transcriptional regulator [Providencia thailandensis]CAK6615137.1 Transcriptional regulator [Providencia stuartii]CAK6616271.1 Transcriptional regulator [Providencia stuartii]CAK6619612.1 Transcriptional regulator [Providencia stuartii]CAK6619690.1 Transcriptional regulator [Providencia stuartii]
MKIQLSVSSPIVTIKNHKAITSSLDVANYFNKLHKNVIQKIQSIECSEEFNQLNFKLVDYIDAKGEKRPMYEMTKDGFVFLVMGFTGKKAAQFKEAYIAEFNRMEAELYGNKIAPTVSQEERDAYNINALAKHYEAIYQIWKEELRPALKTLNSPIYGRLYDRFQDGYVFVKYLQQDLNSKLTNRQLPRHH